MIVWQFTETIKGFVVDSKIYNNEADAVEDITLHNCRHYPEECECVADTGDGDQIKEVGGKLVALSRESLGRYYRFSCGTIIQVREIEL